MHFESYCVANLGQSMNLGLWRGAFDEMCADVILWGRSGENLGKEVAGL